MKIIYAKFKSICAETGKQIKKGEKCLYDANEKKVYSLESEKAKKFETDQQERSISNYIDQVLESNYYNQHY